MKSILLIISLSMFVSCISAAENRKKDEQLSVYKDYQIEVEARIKRDGVKIDSLEHIGELQKEVSKKRDYWFFEYTQTKRDLDSLYKVMYIDER